MPAYLLCLALLATWSRAASSTPQSLECRDIVIPISAEVENKVLPQGLSLKTAIDDTFISKLHILATQRVSGVYNISARYCKPTVDVPSRRNSLQVLIHGATYTKNYWSGLAAPGTGWTTEQQSYSWVDYAAAGGYATLSVDRLCNGNSTRANGLLECQIPLQVETIHGVIQAARGGSLPGISTKYSTVTAACHSYGSLVCNALSFTRPSAIDAYIFTGFSALLVNGLSGIGTRPLFLPASLAFPSQFSTLRDLTYLAATSSSGAEFIFYYDKYSESVREFDFAHRGTVTVGEIATALLGQVVAPAYKGDVFVLNGDEDSIFCQSSPLNPVLGVRGNCSEGFSEGVRALYPAARSFGVWDTPDTGHCLNTHYTAQESFLKAHQWLERSGY